MTDDETQAPPSSPDYLFTREDSERLLAAGVTIDREDKGFRVWGPAPEPEPVDELDDDAPEPEQPERPTALVSYAKVDAAADPVGYLIERAAKL